MWTLGGFSLSHACSRKQVLFFHVSSSALDLDPLDPHKFWLPESGFAKICGSTDSDPMAKSQQKIAKNTNLQFKLLNKEKCWMVFQVVALTISEKNINIKLLRQLINPEPDFDHLFYVRIQDPDPHQNLMDPKHWSQVCIKSCFYVFTKKKMWKTYLWFWRYISGFRGNFRF